MPVMGKRTSSVQGKQVRSAKRFASDEDFVKTAEELFEETEDEDIKLRALNFAARVVGAEKKRTERSKAANLSAMTEAEFLEYERSVVVAQLEALGFLAVCPCCGWSFAESAEKA